MIKKIKTIILECDHVMDFPGGQKTACSIQRKIELKRFQDLETEGWAIGAGGKCYCPAHAPFYRNVGKSGKPRKHVQLKLEEVDGRRK